MSQNVGGNRYMRGAVEMNAFRQPSKQAFSMSSVTNLLRSSLAFPPPVSHRLHGRSLTIISATASYQPNKPLKTPIQRLVERDSLFPVIEIYKGKPVHFSYGTAGFRTLGSHMDRLCFRIGILVAIRAKLHGSSGLMITASHNPKDDNGVKIIECNGDILPMSWEEISEELVNSNDLGKTLERIFDKFNISQDSFDYTSTEHVGFAIDTRDSGPQLVEAAMEACKILKIQTTFFGQCTTPQLHWLVSVGAREPQSAYSYTQYFADMFQWFLSECDHPEKVNYQSELTLDCANGIGAFWIAKMMEQPEFISQIEQVLKIKLINTNYKKTEDLNLNCGAEYVHKDQKLPVNWD